MHTGNVTTPFGRRPMTLALLKGQLEAAGPKPDESVDKWKVFRDICEGREQLGLTDRALSVLNALISFYPDLQLAGDRNLVVFPSNAQLTLRAHGITGTTLRRHLAALIECGLISRKDSPNGKRYAHRSKSGKVEDAFGFSLLPLLTRSREFSELAEKVASDRKALRLAKERLSISRRDIRKLLAAAVEEDAPGDWNSYQDALTIILNDMPRNSSLAAIQAATNACDSLRSRIINTMETQLNSRKMVSCDIQNERHLQNSDTYTIYENKAPQIQQEIPARASTTRFPLGSARTISLASVLKACPQIVDYAPGGMISGWQDMQRATTVVRMMLGISSNGYEAACRVMGAENTAAVIACILERGGAINSAGGYLRDLTRRAERAEFTLEPMLAALLGAKARTPLETTFQ